MLNPPCHLNSPEEMLLPRVNSMPSLRIAPILHISFVNPEVALIGLLYSRSLVSFLKSSTVVVNLPQIASFDYRRDIFHLFFDTVILCPVLAITVLHLAKTNNAPFSETADYK